MTHIPEIGVRKWESVYGTG